MVNKTTRAVVTAGQLDQLARDHLGRDYYQFKSSCLKRDGLPVPEDIEAALRAPAQQPPASKPVGASASMIVPRVSGGYGAAALVGECERVRSAPNGDRNNTLNRAAFRLGQLVALQLLTRSEVERELWAAVGTHRTGSDGAEWERHQGGTIRRGVTAGIENPRAESPVGIIDGYTAPADESAGTSGANLQLAQVSQELPLIYYEDVKPSLDAADFVENTLGDGAMSVLYGDSNTGKSFFALDLALHVALGRVWRGLEVERRGVLYLALEGSHGIQNRVAAFKLANLMSEARLPFAIVPVVVNLLVPAGDVFRVIEAAKRAAEHVGIPIGLIVVDTLSRAIAGGNENSSEDMGALVRHLDLIRQALPAHVMVIHHSGKDSARGARGHSLLRAATDTEIEVSRGPGGTTATARVTKQREMELGAEFSFSLTAVTLGLNRRGKPVTSCVVRHDDAPKLDDATTRAIAAEQQRNRREREKEEAQESAVMLAVEAECATQPGASKSAIQKRTKFAWAKVGAILERLLEKGRVTRCNPYKRTTGHGAEVEVAEAYKPAEPEQSSPFGDGD